METELGRWAYLGSEVPVDVEDETKTLSESGSGLAVLYKIELSLE